MKVRDRNDFREDNSPVHPVCSPAETLRAAASSELCWSRSGFSSELRRSERGKLKRTHERTSTHTQKRGNVFVEGAIYRRDEGSLTASQLHNLNAIFVTFSSTEIKPPQSKSIKLADFHGRADLRPVRLKTQNRNVDCHHVKYLRGHKTHT